MTDIVLIGGGGHCKSCIDVIEEQGQYSIAGIIDRVEKMGHSLIGYPYIGTDDHIPSLADRYANFFICTGQIRSSELRVSLFNAVNRAGAELPVIVSPQAYTSSHAAIGRGTIIMHRAVVNSDADIGNNCIVNTGAIVEHDVEIGSHTHISTGVILNGGVCIGERTFIGSGSVVREGVTIGDNVIISAGTTVMKNVPSGSIVK